MTDKCVVNIGDGLWYGRGSQRLANSLDKFGEDAIQMITHRIPNGCLPHKRNPYGFKAYIIQEALHRGHKRIFWLDSSIYLNKPMTWAWEEMDRTGYCFFYAGHWTGTWCADHALSKLKITREESFGIPLLCGGIMGLNFNFEVAREFFAQYMNRAGDGSFVGAWTNEKKQVSDDDRVKGHRHDQTCASVIAYQLGMRNLHNPPLFVYRHGSNENIKQETIFVAEGMTMR